METGAVRVAVATCLAVLAGLGPLASGAAVAQRRTPSTPARPAPARPAPKLTLLPPPRADLTFLPSGALEEFVVSQFDIRTINSTMNLGREVYQARLTEVGYRPQTRRRATDPLVMAGPAGQITLSLFERGDHNLDGIEDVVVCLLDRPTSAPMTRQLLVLQKYSDTTPLVALAVSVNDPRCPPLP